MHTSTNFVLKGGDMGFANRQKLLFDQLSMAEKECHKDKEIATSSNREEMDMCVVKNNRPLHSPRCGVKRKAEMSKFRGRESIFKRPEGPAPKSIIRSIPDHHRNPHKWIKYTLDDVSNDDMTDRSNAQAAFSFLKELKARKAREQVGKAEKMDVDETEENEEKQCKTSCYSRKIKPPSGVEFKKPDAHVNVAEQSATVIVDHDNKPIFKSSKVIMPEYVVGQKPKRKTKKEHKKVNVDRTKELKLDHLQELDEDDV